jgi:hypothetical protein
MPYSHSPPNQRVQPTPLAASEIVPFLKLGFGSTVISIYYCGAADAQPVMRQARRMTENGKKTRVKGIHRDRSI